MKIKILTLFPEMFESVLGASILGRARRQGLLQIELVNLRDYARNRHNHADDYPFGGGAGMVMLPQMVVDAVEAQQEAGMRRVYLSPRGRVFTQKVAEEYARCESLLLLCGHYEGVDQRALDLCIDEELSIGDYVLTGGELGAMVAVDAVARLIPGVLGSDESSGDESFTTGLLEYPQYTRPAEFRDLRVPQVLLEGNHADIQAWRRRQALELTRARRPELLDRAPLDESDRQILRRAERCEASLNDLKRAGIGARRMEMFAERGYAKAWFAHVVPEARRAAAKKQCFSGRRHVGFLYQAFEMDFAPCVRGAAAQAAFLQKRGPGALYFNRDDICLELEEVSALEEVKPCQVLSAPDFAWAFARSGAGELYFYHCGENPFPMDPKFEPICPVEG